MERADSHRMEVMLITAVLVLFYPNGVESAAKVTIDISCCSPEKTCDFVQYLNRQMRSASWDHNIQYPAGTPYEDCVTACIDWTDWVCLSATYEETTGTCYLSKKNLQSSGASLASADSWAYFDMDVASCGPVTCAQLSIPNGILNPSSAVIDYNNAVTITCATGYELTGPSTLTCVNADTYDAAAPTCDLVSCGTAPVYADMTADQSGPLDYPQPVTYTCSPGYYKSTTENVVCSATGVWTVTTEPVCIEVFCTEPVIADGSITSTGPYPDQSVVSIECDPGFVLTSGDPTLVCDASGSSPTGTWIGTMPTCGFIECTAPVVQYATVNPPTGPHGVGDTITYNCDVGYIIEQGSTTLTCQDDSQWNTTPISCIIDACPNIPMVTGVVGFTGGYVYDEEPLLTCAPGYRSTSPSTLKCGPGGSWLGDPIVCEKNECDLPSIPDSTVTEPDPYHHTDTVTVVCDGGFERTSGDEQLTCDATTNPGVWIGSIPECNRVECAEISVPNSSTEPPAPHYYQDTVTYTCSTGYSMTGPSTLTCQADTSWDLSPPVCIINSCPDIPMATGVEGFAGGYVYQDQPALSCAVGYHETSPSPLICGEDGSWIGDPIICEQTICALPTVPDSTTDQPAPYYHTDTVTYTCDDGFERTAGDEQLTCDATTNPGVWIGSIPECNRVECAEIAVPNSSTEPPAPHYYQDTVTYTCLTGYSMTGVAILSCEADTSWDLSPPVCTINSCPDIPMATGVEGFAGGYVYQDQPALSCAVGYHETSPSSLICGEDGSWIGSPIVCEQTICPLPTIPDSTTNQPEPYYHTDSVTVICDSGYEVVSGDETLVCDATSNPGSWVGIVPVCDRRQCPTITVPDSMSSPQGPHYYTDTVTYSCSSGYNLTGSEMLTCQSDETWDYQVPYCTRNRCPDMMMETGVDGFIGSYVSFDTPSLTCTLGYHSLQSSTLECNEWGQWTGTPPQCARTECAAPTITNSMISPPAPYYNNDKISVTCDRGYKIASGSSSLSCDASASPGVWVGNIPVCSLITCMARDIPYGTYSNFPTTTFGLDSLITYTCDKGHKLLGSAQLLCLSTGRWTYPEPSCQPYRCPSEPVEGGTISTVGPYLWTNKISYICDKGFNISGDASRTCGSTGQWESPAPTCVPNECVIPSSSGIRADDSGPYLYGDRVDMRCSDNTKYISGWEFLVCDQYGAWDREMPKCKRYECEKLKINNGTTVSDNKPPYYIGDTMQFQCTHIMMLQGKSSLSCIAPESGDKGVWDGEPPTCTSILSEKLAQFEGKDEWLNWFLPLLAAAALAAAITACCCWFFCCGGRRRRKHADDCECDDCDPRPDTPIKEEKEVTPPPSPTPVPIHNHAITSSCAGSGCATKHMSRNHISCAVNSGTCGPPPAYSTHRHHSIHPLGCGVSHAYHPGGYMGLSPMPMMMHSPIIGHGPATMVPVHSHGYSNQAYVSHREPAFRRRPPTPHGSIDSGPEPEGNCIHGIPTGVCKICPPPASQGGLIMVQPISHEKTAKPTSLPSNNNKKIPDANRCRHGINKVDCDVCGPQCVHGEPKRKCRKCDLCPHDENPSTCTVCMLEKCPHGKARAGICGLCKQGLCPHGNDAAICSFCSQLTCSHGKDIKTCSKCRKCAHGKTITNCSLCKAKLPKGRRNSLSEDPDGKTGMKFLEKSSRAKSESNLLGRLNEAKRVPAAAKKLKLPEKAAWMPHSNNVRSDANHKYTSTK